MGNALWRLNSPRYKAREKSREMALGATAIGYRKPLCDFAMGVVWEAVDFRLRSDATMRDYFTSAFLA
jgi:hypothetical protein